MDECEQEPCGSARRAVIKTQLELAGASAAVNRACAVRKRIAVQLTALLVIWAVLLVNAVVCSLYPHFASAALCAMLWGLSAAIAALAILFAALLAVAAQHLARLQDECHARRADYRIAFVEMTDKCPRECWYIDLGWDCDCD